SSCSSGAAASHAGSGGIAPSCSGSHVILTGSVRNVRIVSAAQSPLVMCRVLTLHLEQQERYPLLGTRRSRDYVEHHSRPRIDSLGPEGARKKEKARRDRHRPDYTLRRLRVGESRDARRTLEGR